jgi:hypothetical protein
MESDDGCVVGCGKSGGGPWGGKPPFRTGKRLWFYRVKDRDASTVDRRPPQQVRRPRRLNFDRLFAGWWREAHARGDWLADLADELGVSVGALGQLGIGWAPAARAGADGRGDAVIIGTATPCRPPGAWVFPMRGQDRRIVGSRVRTGRGSKYAVNTTDGDGVFAPTGLRTRQTLLLPEGPTSTAALLSIGMNTIGRPANRGGVPALLAYVSLLRPTRVIVVGDLDLRWNDRVEPARWDWPGHDGAREIEAELLAAGVDVEVRFPAGSHKDVRDWVRSGATAADVRLFWGRSVVTTARRAS